MMGDALHDQDLELQQADVSGPETQESFTTAVLKVRDQLRAHVRELYGDLETAPELVIEFLDGLSEIEKVIVQKLQKLRPLDFTVKEYEQLSMVIRRRVMTLI
jgi:hypothetical protein